MKTVFTFSGQGSQFFQMGVSLMEGHAFFKEKMMALDQTAKSINGVSVLDVLYSGKKGEPFTKLVHTYPAVFMVEHALCATLMQHEGITPDYVVGASMGEFAAAVAAGIMTAEEALQTLITHGIEVERALTPKQGGMLAIMRGVDYFDHEPWLHGQCELAAVNSDRQITVAGGSQALHHIKNQLKEHKVDYLDIPVDYAFHSKAIDPLAAFSLALVDKIPRRTPKIPFVSGLRGQHLNQLDNEYFWDVVRQPIQYQQAILAIEKDPATKTYLDLGPAGSMAAFTKQILADEGKNSHHVYPIINMFGAGMANLQTVRKHFDTITEKDTPMGDHIKTAYLFPGQGSQKVGMGASLFEAYPAETAKADQILGYSIKALCLEATAKKLAQTQYTQPALYVVDCLTYLEAVKQSGKKPHFVAGHSLGEYAALFAAGVFDFETGLRLVQKRGELMGNIKNGGMAALIGMDKEEVAGFLANNGFDDIDLANINSPVQIVVSGPKDRVQELGKVFGDKITDKKKAFVPINTSGAFHSRYMKEASDEFTQFLASFEYHEPSIPVISNAEVSLYTKGTVAKLLAKQLVQPVRWVEAMQLLIAMGVGAFEEQGPGEVLTKLYTSINKRPVPDEAYNKAEVMLQALGVAPKLDTSLQNGHAANGNGHSNGHGNGNGAKPQKTATNGMALGSNLFRQNYQAKYAYMVAGLQGGAMSYEMLKTLRINNILGFLGTSIVPLADTLRIVEAAKQDHLPMPYGLTVMYDQLVAIREEQVLALAAKNDIPYIEAVGYLQPSTALVRYKFSQVAQSATGKAYSPRKIFARASRPEIAQMFLSPPSAKVLAQLTAEGVLTPQQAEMAKQLPIADELIIEGNSGWNYLEYTPEVLLPLIENLRDQLLEEHQLNHRAGLGVAGDIGSPHSAVTAFMLGADFVVTESVNCCTQQAALSAEAKDMLQAASVQDIEYAPSLHQFELGGKEKVLRKGVFFPARAGKLYELYQSHASIDEIGAKDKEKLAERYFKLPLAQVWEEAKTQICLQDQALIQKAEANPKYKMALMFRWYLWRGWQAALSGEPDNKVNYHISCSPALGACNHWLKGTGMENWQNRDVVALADKIMADTAALADEQTRRLRQVLEGEKAMA